MLNLKAFFCVEDSSLTDSWPAKRSNPSSKNLAVLTGDLNLTPGYDLQVEVSTWQTLDIRQELHKN